MKGKKQLEEKFQLFVASNLGKARLGHFWFRSTLVLIDTLVISCNSMKLSFKKKN